MKVHVSAKTNAKVESIEAKDAFHLKVAVKEPAKEGKANKAVIKLLAEYFDVPKSQIQLVSGEKSRGKVFEVG